MGFTRKSDFIIGDDSTYNLSSFLECLQKTYAGVGIYDLMNFSNTGIPGLKAGAIIDVQGTLYVLDADTQAVYRDAGGTVSALSGAPDGEYYLALIDAGETVTIAALLISATTIARSSSYAGYYETGTTNRIIGGFTKTGTSYTAKWRYQYQTHEDSYVKVTSDGVYLTANDVSADVMTANTLNVGNISASGQTLLAKYKQTYHELNAEFLPNNVTGFVVTSPCIIYMTYQNYYPGPGYGIAVNVGSTQYPIDYVDGRAFMLLPGRYIATTNNTKIIVLNACHDTLADVMYNL